MDGKLITQWVFLGLGSIVCLFGLIEAALYIFRPIPIFSERVQSHLFDPGESCYCVNRRGKFKIPGNYKRYFLICYEPDPTVGYFRCQFMNGTMRKDIGVASTMEQAILICKQYKPKK